MSRHVPIPALAVAAARQPHHGCRAVLQTLVVLGLLGGAGRAHALDFYVDQSIGSDGYSVVQAQSPATPWKTIGKALSDGARAKSNVWVAAGTYPEAVKTSRRGVRLHAVGNVVITPPAGTIGIQIANPRVLVEGFTIVGGLHGVRAQGALGAVIRGCTIQGQSGNGIMVVESKRVLVDGNRVDRVAQQGIVMKRSERSYVHDNLVTQSGEWGIHVDNGDPPLPRRTDNNVVAFNTVHANGRLLVTGGIRFQQASGEIRDNVVTSNRGSGVKTDLATTLVHHNDVFASSLGFDSVAGTTTAWANLTVSPGYVDPAHGDFRLRQTAAGEDTTSACVDAGSAPIGDADISGSTRSDGGADVGTADLGHHDGAAPVPRRPPPIADVPPDFGPRTYVDCAAGDDTRTRGQAQDPSTPWRTVQQAANQSVAGDVVVVKPGTCRESVAIDRAGITLRSESPLAAVLSPAQGATGLAVRASNVTVEGFVVRSNKEGVVVAAKNAGDVLSRVQLRGLRVGPRARGTVTTNGIRAQDVDRIRVESCTVDGADQQGIVVKRASAAWIRNNLVTGSGEWGIHVDNGDPPAPASTTGQIVAFNTVVGSGRLATSGGIRLQNASGEIRDNVLAGNAGSGVKIDQASTVVHHNLVFASSLPIERVGAVAASLWANLTVDPQFSAAGADYTLQQTAAGQDETSPAVDAGSGDVATRDVSGSTRRDGVADTGTADLGYHAGAGALPDPPAIATASLSTFYVDAVAGDDGRSAGDARSPARPWRTITRALAGDGAGTTDTVLVAAGTYGESVHTTRPGVTLRATGPAVIEAPPGGVGIEIAHALVTVDGFVVHGGVNGIRADAAPNLTVRGCSLSGQSGDALLLVQSDDAVVDGNRVDGAAGRGIVVKRAGYAYVRNNLVTRSGDWGIHIDNGDTPLPPPTTGHVVAFNTVYGSGFAVAASGGIRVQNATGEVRDNLAASNVGSAVKTDTAPMSVHHNAVFGSLTRFDTKTGAEPFLWSNVTADPLLGDPASGDFTLREVAAGQSATSPAVDAGSGAVAERDISGSTRRDGAADTGVANIGYHAAAAAGGPLPPPVPTPATTPIPAAGSGVNLYVDPVAGDDGRNVLDAQSPGSGWKTIARALLGAEAGDVIQLAAGTYPEAVQLTRDAITLRGAGHLGDVVLAPPAGSPGVYVNGRTGDHLENLVIQGGTQGVVGSSAPGLTLRRVAIVGPTTNGVQVTSSAGVVIDSCIVTGAGTQGILLGQSGNAYVRNNLVYANTEWAITLDSSGSPLPAPAIGNVIAFNTVHANGKGIRMLNASGEIRDNEITSQTDVGLYLAGPNLLAHHNDFSANGRDRDQDSSFAATIRVWASLGQNPRYVKPAGVDGILGGVGWRDDDFHLRQLPGQTPASPMVDAGSGLASALDISGSTRSDGVADAGVADVGVHDGAAPAGTPPPFGSSTSLQLTYYVSATSGLDSRSRSAALTRTTPWQTISHALQQSGAGDTIVVLPGTYAETVQIQATNVTVIAETPGTVTIVPPTSASANGFTIERGGATVDGFLIQGATNNGISVLAGVAGTRIRNCAVLGARAEGIRATTLDDILVQDSLVIGSGSSGILLRQVTNATVRNNLVYDSFEWGISIDNSAASGPAPPVATGQLVERNTSAFNGLGNLRVANALGTVRDNLLTDTPGTGLRIDTAGSTLLNNGFFATARDIEPDRYIVDSCNACAANLRLDPSYLNPAGSDGVRGVLGWADDDFRLAQRSAGQAIDSAAVDAGSGSALVLAATGTTAANGQPDAGIVDLGFHYASSSRAIAPLVPPPASGMATAASSSLAPTTAAPAMVASLVARATLLPSATPTPPPPSAAPLRAGAPPASTPSAGSSHAPAGDPATGTVYVDAARGEDARACDDARAAATPLRSIGRALACAASSDVVALAAGTYAENVAIATGGVTLRGVPGSTRIVALDAHRPALRVRGARGVTVQGLDIEGGATGLVAGGDVAGLRIVDVAVTATGGDGVVLGKAGPVSIERSSVRGVAGDGIVARRTRALRLDDVLVADAGGAGLRLTHADTVARFVTARANRAFGVRVAGGALVLRHAIVSGNALAGLASTGGGAPTITDSFFWQNGVDLDPATTPVGPGTRFCAPPETGPAGADDRENAPPT